MLYIRKWVQKLIDNITPYMHIELALSSTFVSSCSLFSIFIPFVKGLRDSLVSRRAVATCCFRAVGGTRPLALLGISSLDE